MRLAGSTAARVGGAAIAMVVAAELAVWVLSPDGFVADPLPVAAGKYFSDSELQRALDFRGPQRWLTVAGLVIELAVLLAVALGRPAWLRRALDRLAARPLAGAAVAGAAVAVLVAIATVPTALIGHERAVDVGLSSQSLGPWAWDLARATAITAALTAAGTTLLIALVRRLGSRWWLPGAALVAALAVAFVWIAPVLLAPVFNDFEPLPEGSPARARVLALGERAEVEIGEVYSVDASRRVTSLNAYVDGIGSTKRVVLYDNLLDRARPAELESVVAHELGHVAGQDLRRGLLYIALVAPLGMLFVRELGAALARRSGADPAAPAAAPGYLLALALAALVLNVPGNQLSRRVEARADAFAIELTGDPGALVDLQLRLARQNLTDPDPPGLYSVLFATHPTTLERIGAALAQRSPG
jgi:STE24 endopeptidase